MKTERPDVRATGQAVGDLEFHHGLSDDECLKMAGRLHLVVLQILALSQTVIRSCPDLEGMEVALALIESTQPLLIAARKLRTAAVGKSGPSAGT